MEGAPRSRSLGFFVPPPVASLGEEQSLPSVGFGERNEHRSTDAGCVLPSASQMPAGSSLSVPGSQVLLSYGEACGGQSTCARACQSVQVWGSVGGSPLWPWNPSGPSSVMNMTLGFHMLFSSISSLSGFRTWKHHLLGLLSLAGSFHEPSILFTELPISATMVHGQWK